VPLSRRIACARWSAAAGSSPTTTTDRFARAVGRGRRAELCHWSGTAVLTLDAGRDRRSYVQRITGNGVDTYFERCGAELADYADSAWGHVKDRCVPR
jgi:hypothetical protein